MCFVVFSFKEHSKYKLIFCANRDEFYNRKTEKVRYWGNDENILAGKDLEGGGTWLGITKTGRFAALTNFREGGRKNPEKTSRGLIVREYLESDGSPLKYVKYLEEKKEDFEGFNLLFGNKDELYYFSNRSNGLLPVTGGMYGLSNATLETPWPKIRRGKKLFSDILSESNITPEKLFDLLRDDKKPDTKELPDTGVPKEFEKELSPIFVNMPGYGTRSSNVIFIDYNDNVEFYEKIFDSSGDEVNHSYYYFQIT